jgi:hypothetical protein
MKWMLTLAIFMCGVSAKAQISASPSFIDFGDLTVNQGWRQTSVWVRNNSNQPLNLYVSNSCFGSFYSYNNCYSMQPYGSCSIQVEFRPRREGYESCNINISANPSGYASISIRGRGVDAAQFEVNTPYAE